MYQPILRDWIWAEGRGPILRCVHYAGVPKLKVVALDYLNPDSRSDADLRHLVVHQAQVSMFTPEEVHNYAREGIDWGPSVNRAAVVNLNRSDWLLAFEQRHLARCNHYRLMFYDQILDLICEGITAATGPYHE
jgi:hypothetical protein